MILVSPSHTHVAASNLAIAKKRTYVPPDLSASEFELRDALRVSLAAPEMGRLRRRFVRSLKPAVPTVSSSLAGILSWPTVSPRSSSDDMIWCGWVGRRIWKWENFAIFTGERTNSFRSLWSFFPFLFYALCCSYFQLQMSRFSSPFFLARSRPLNSITMNGGSHSISDAVRSNSICFCRGER